MKKALSIRKKFLIDYGICAAPRNRWNVFENKQPQYFRRKKLCHKLVKIGVNNVDAAYLRW